MEEVESYLGAEAEMNTRKAILPGTSDTRAENQKASGGFPGCFSCGCVWLGNLLWSDMRKAVT